MRTEFYTHQMQSILRHLVAHRPRTGGIGIEPINGDNRCSSDPLASSRLSELVQRCVSTHTLCMRKWLFLVLMVAVVAAGAAVTIDSNALVSGPAAPTNVEAIEVGQDYVKLAWGPSQPGPFTNLGEPRKNQLLIGWGVSEDSRSAVTYTLVKDGVTLATGLIEPQYLVTGLSSKVRSFRVCVTAVNVAGQLSPQACGTFSR